MENLVSMQGINKSYKSKAVLKNINLTVGAGQVLGLVGPNGSGKTTCLQALLGLIGVEGDISILADKSNKARHHTLQDVAYIADVAVLPKWLKVFQAIEYMQGVHPKFDANKARAFLAKTNIELKSKVGTLSKGMVAQVHLALVLAVDAKILVLDEPTLGLDILTRKQFYSHLLEDFYTQDKCIIITTHQIEEIENILTDVAFLNHGELVLSQDVDSLQQRFKVLTAEANADDATAQFTPLHTTKMMGVTSMLIDTQGFNEDKIQRLTTYGKVSSANLADIFVGIVSQETQA